ncbi:MAG: hypothetical protein WC670_06315 [Pseudolabrys sp.]|jgi:hypothetical protein
MIRRQTIVFAVAGIAGGIAGLAMFATLAAEPARALTFENYQGADNATGWADLNYSDPNKKTSTQQNDPRNPQTRDPTFRFGPSEGSFGQRYDSNSYFTPNNILGK